MGTHDISFWYLWYHTSFVPPTIIYIHILHCGLYALHSRHDTNTHALDILFSSLKSTFPSLSHHTRFLQVTFPKEKRIHAHQTTSSVFRETTLRFKNTPLRSQCHANQSINMISCTSHKYDQLASLVLVYISTYHVARTQQLPQSLDFNSDRSRIWESIPCTSSRFLTTPTHYIERSPIHIKYKIPAMILVAQRYQVVHPRFIVDRTHRRRA